ncbi:MAG TPA: GNAT family N-acetyltransferase [Balneolaceae bacterium]|nr:GNAT family N-acetyltransferase [Balneolaceae bacterium]
MANIKFEKLTRNHNRQEFNCGEQHLNSYIQRFARQNAKNDLGENYILTNNSKEILGFYTINTASLDYEAYPENKGLPKYAITSALIGRLAVDRKYHGNGYGKLLLIDALKRILKISDEIGIHCITVDAKDKNAKKFYTYFGFDKLVDEEKHLYISIEKVRKSFL